MAYENFFIEGLDPTGLAAFGSSEALQMIREARTGTVHGMIYYSATAPDLVNNPEYARFVWVNPTTGEFKYWTGTTWTQFALAIGSLSGTLITPGTLALNALTLTGANALDLIRVNAAGTGYVFESAANLYANGTFPVAKLVPGASDGMFLRMSGGAAAWAWLTSAEIISIIAAHSIRLNKLYVADATAGYVPAYDAAVGSYVPKDPNTLITFPTPTATLPQIEVFDNTNATPNTPANFIWTATKTLARVRVWGGGGGGDYGPGAGNIAGGGGAGGYFEGNIVTVPGTTYNIVVGGFGSKGLIGSTTPATAGDASTIMNGAATMAKANGGSAAAGLNSGAGGATLGGYANSNQIAGGSGYPGSNAASSGYGGNSPNGGQGGAIWTDLTAVLSAKTPGGGGGGGCNADGGDGAPGRVIIEY